MNPTYFIGPMSKNVVDSIIEFSRETNNQIGLIPSRRQVEWSGGYANNWTTEEFAGHANSLILQRDHAGPGQGQKDDDGYKSLKEDCKYFDLIHVDPWKKYPKYKEGLRWTINMIEFCHKENPNMQYEVGTEEAIRRSEPEELNSLIRDLKAGLKKPLFSQIKYLVIQSGTALKENVNTGEYDKNKLLAMTKVAKAWGLMSKEHNGDYIPAELIKEKISLGLDSINIAPEFGLIETMTYINNGIDIDKFWKICYNSKRWVKWVDSNFDPLSQKEDLIKICGHYVLSHPEFLAIKPNVTQQINFNIKQKLHELYG